MRGTAKETVHPCPDPIGRVYWYRIILRYITTARKRTICACSITCMWHCLRKRRPDSNVWKTRRVNRRVKWTRKLPGGYARFSFYVSPSTGTARRFTRSGRTFHCLVQKGPEQTPYEQLRATDGLSLDTLAVLAAVAQSVHFDTRLGGSFTFYSCFRYVR